MEIMNNDIKQLAPQILAEINRAKNILLHLHPGPDPDSVGSALAMKGALTLLDKQATVIKGDSNKPTGFSHLAGFNEIVEKSLVEINQADFDLFIILDSGSADMVSKISQIDPSLKTVVIDHHKTNPKYGHINLVVPSSSTCEVLFYLFKEWNLNITAEMATNLFVGMYYDTGGFKYESATKETLLASAELVSIAPKFSEALFEIENQNEPGHVAFRALALNSVETFFNDRVAISAVSFEKMEKRGIEARYGENQNISNYLKSVKGWEIGISAFERKPNQTYVSFRTRDANKFDVSQITQALGGGGHKAAAGALILKSANEAKKDILSAVEKIYPEFSQ